MRDPGNLDETVSGVRDGDGDGPSAAFTLRVEWFDPTTALPQHGQQCLLMPHDRGGLVTVAVYGPISFDADMGAWCDLFRSSEAGEIVSAKDVGRWTLWGPIAPRPADIAQAADTSARNVPAREGSSNASRAATGPLPRLATDDEPSAADETAWLIEETWSGFVHYVHRDFNAAAWRAEAGRVRQISRRKQRFITKNIAEAMRFSTKEAAEDWRSEQPIWFSRGDQFQVREHMWPDPSPPVAMRHGSDANAEPSGKED